MSVRGRNVNMSTKQRPESRAPDQRVQDSDDLSTTETRTQKLWESLREPKVAVKKIKDIITRDFTILQQSETDSGDKGLTPFHIAIARGDKTLVETMLSTGKLENKDNLFKMKCTEVRFKNTIIDAQLPLSIAALTLKRDVIDVLLDHKASLHQTNDAGDNVYHCLVRHANYDNVDEVIAMMKHIHSKSGKHADLWFQRNNKDQTPLLLAVKQGKFELFEYIMSIPDVYYRPWADEIFKVDGLDVRSYNVTETDSVQLSNSWCPYGGKKTAEPVLRAIFRLPRETTERFVGKPVIQKSISEKWKKYKTFFRIWFVIHAVMLVLVSYAVVRMADTLELPDPREAEQWYITTIFSFNFVYSLIIILLQLKQVLCRGDCRRRKCDNHLYNRTYRVVLLAFAISAIIDHVLYFFNIRSVAKDIFLVITVLSGYTFILFFLRVCEKFSFFTVMIQLVLFKDFIRFIVFFLIFLMGYTVVTHVVIQSANLYVSGNTSFVDQAWVLSAIVLGLADVLPEDAPVVGVSWQLWLVYYFFTITTYVIILNALIALMSGTCTDLAKRKNSVWLTQKLAVILFLEGIIPEPFLLELGKINGINEEKNNRWMTVFSKDMKPLDEETKFSHRKQQPRCRKWMVRNAKLYKTEPVPEIHRYRNDSTELAGSS